MNRILKYSLSGIMPFSLLLFTHLSGNAQEFPIKVSENKRYFVDQSGTPFFYHGDTGWQIFVKLTYEEAKLYLQDRKNKGFTVIQVQMSAQPEDVNRYGERPFHNMDFTKPNEKYFNHIARVIQLADSMKLLINIAPLWLSCCNDGYGMAPHKPFAVNGAKKTRIFGKYLGKKFGEFKNVIWIMGGDNDPMNDREVIESMAMGIYETAPHQLICYHASASHSSTDLFQFAPWLGYSMVYTYYTDMKRGNWRAPEQIPQVYEECLREYNKSDRMPFILGESQYEEEFGGNPFILRRQAYWTMTSGGAGHCVGTPLWNFPGNWKDKLDMPGINSMTHMKLFFERLPWWTFVPDQRHKLCVSGYGRYGDDDYVTTVISENEKVAVSYFPSFKIVTMNMKALQGNVIKAKWFNPRNGEFIGVNTEMKREMVDIMPPDSGDWVLLLEAE